MSAHRIDFVDTDLQTGWGDLNAMPKHEPVIRPDKEPAMFECSGCGECVTSCPSPMVCLGMEARKQHNAAIHRADVIEAGRLLRIKHWLGEGIYWIAAALCILLMFAAPRAFAADAETTATIAAGADTVTTVAAITTGAGFEANAIMANPVAFAALSAVKLAAPRLTRGMEPETRRTALRSMSTIWGGAAANNLAVIAGIGCPVCVGVAVGAWLWITSDNPPEPVSTPEAGAAVAMVQQ